MTVPNFQSIMLPLLSFAADRKEHSIHEATEALALTFGLSVEDRNQLYPSGKKKTIFADRVGWARTYLKQAGLVEDTRRAYFRITDRGISVIQQQPARVDMKFLEQFSEYQVFKSRTRPKTGYSIRSALSSDMESIQTPKEAIELNYQKIRDTLAEELLGIIRRQSSGFFERLVVELLVKMGYGGSIKDAGEAIGRSGDEGIDGIIKEDKLGFDIIYLQAKRWERTIGRPEIQQFAGALDGQRAKKGVFITTAAFTKEARDYVRTIDKKIVLIDGQELAQLMVDHNVGVTIDTSYELKKIDSDYFSGE